MSSPKIQEPPAAAPRQMTPMQAKRRREMLEAADHMAKMVRAEHRRWGHPLVLWKDGQIVYEDP